LLALLGLGGCASGSPSHYISPQVIGRVLDAQTHQPLANVRVQRIDPHHPSQRQDITTGAEAGAMMLRQPLTYHTDEAGRFKLESITYFAVFRTVGWHSVSVSFQHKGYAPLDASYTPTNATNSPSGEPVVNAADILLQPLTRLHR
jgi:hypothetical protein